MDLKIVEEKSKIINNVNNIDNNNILNSPKEFKITDDIKRICHKYNIIFINGYSFKNKSILLAQYIISKIESVYNKEKYWFYKLFMLE